MATSSIVWKMHCSVNNSVFELNGQGLGDSSTGLVELNLKGSNFPLGFDPSVCPYICNAPISICFARTFDNKNAFLEVAGSHFYIQPARIAVIHDSRGKEVLRLSVKSVISVIDGQVFTDNEMTGFSNLPSAVQGILPLNDYIVPGGPGEATGILRFKLLTKTGEVLHGLTTIPYSWEGISSLEAPVVRTFENIQVHSDNSSNVCIQICSSIISAKSAVVKA